MNKFNTCFIQAVLCGIWMDVTSDGWFKIAIGIVSIVFSSRAVYYVFMEEFEGALDSKIL